MRYGYSKTEEKVCQGCLGIVQGHSHSLPTSLLRRSQGCFYAGFVGIARKTRIKTRKRDGEASQHAEVRENGNVLGYRERGPYQRIFFLFREMLKDCKDACYTLQWYWYQKYLSQMGI